MLAYRVIYASTPVNGHFVAFAFDATKTCNSRLLCCEKEAQVINILKCEHNGYAEENHGNEINQYTI